jgi:hypothetical protein
LQDLTDHPDEMIPALIQAMGGHENKAVRYRMTAVSEISQDYLLKLAEIPWHDEPENLPAFPTEIFPEGTGKPAALPEA